MLQKLISLDLIRIINGNQKIQLLIWDSFKEFGMFFNGIKGIVDKKLGLVFFPLCVCVLGRGIYNAIALLFAQLFCHLSSLLRFHTNNFLLCCFCYFFPLCVFRPKIKRERKKRKCDVPITHTNPICSSL